VSVADIVAADWVTLPFSPASYVCVDRAGKTVVLAIRGTVSTGDLLTDAVSTSTPFLGGWAHSGMVMSAYQVCKTQLPNAAAALVNNPGFNFLVTGHSMGAGVAAILAMLVHSGDADVLAAAEKAAKEAEAKRQKADGGGDDFREREEADGSLSVGLADGAMAAVRAVRCHCFAAPSVCSLDLSLNARKHTVSVVAGKDVIPRLCYAAVRRLLRRLNAAAPSQPVMKAISAALGGRDKDKKTENSGFETSARESEPVPSPSKLFGEEPETETTSTPANTDSLGIPSKPKPKTKDLSAGERKRKRKAVSGRVGRRLRRARAGTSRSLRERFSRSARLRDPPAAPDVRFRPDRRGQAPHGVHGDPDKHAHDGGPRPDGVPERHRSRRRAKRTRREARRGGCEGV
jgi:hypothetical protein